MIEETLTEDERVRLLRLACDEADPRAFELMDSIIAKIGGSGTVLVARRERPAVRRPPAGLGRIGNARFAP